jgi:hypothetical protein
MNRILPLVLLCIWTDVGYAEEEITVDLPGGPDIGFRLVRNGPPVATAVPGGSWGQVKQDQQRLWRNSP